MSTLELVIFSGLQASGKSHFFHDRFATTHVHVSKDLMKNARNRDAKQAVAIEETLSAGRSVVVDNTNPRAEDRAPLIAIGRHFGARIVGYQFLSTVAASVRRNELREGKAKIPKVGIFTTAKKLKPLTYDEGFDEIFEVELSRDDVVSVRPLPKSDAT